MNERDAGNYVPSVSAQEETDMAGLQPLIQQLFGGRLGQSLLHMMSDP